MSELVIRVSSSYTGRRPAQGSLRPTPPMASDSAPEGSVRYHALEVAWTQEYMPLATRAGTRLSCIVR